MSTQSPCTRKSNVVPLRDAVRERQEHIKARVLESVADTRPPNERMIACLGAAILPTGEVRTSIMCVEPEHAPALLEALETLQDRLRKYMESTKIAVRCAVGCCVAAAVDAQVATALAYSVTLASL